MIDEITVQKILDTANIVDVVQDFVSLKKNGTNFKGLCPFHDEKTPSFVVSPAKGIYKCFGCGAAGNSTKFVMEHEKLSFFGALKYLAKKYNIEIIEKELSEKDIEEKKERDSLVVVNEFAKNFFKDKLNNSSEGKNVALAYFTERGFTPEIINKFELGWSPSVKDALTKHATEKGHKIKFLEILGLTITKQETNSSFDRFSDRVIFPVHSLSGFIAGFGGRTLKADKKIAKYLNSPESELYNKSKILYGLYFAKNAIVKNDKCYMVEGYTDVISMHMSGVENVVASSGTSLTESQIKLVRKFTENLTIIYDGDFAGIKASLRGIDMVLAEGLNVKIVLLPEGEDPDSFSRKMNYRNFSDYIRQNEQDFIKFKTKLLLDEAKDEPVKRASLVSDIVKSISVIGNQILRAEYIKECSLLLKISEEILFSEVSKKITEKLAKNTVVYQPKETFQPKTQTERQSKNILAPVEKEILYYILNFGNKEIYLNQNENDKISVAEFCVKQITSEELTFTEPVYSEIFEVCRMLVNNKKNIDISYFTAHKNQKVSFEASDLFSPIQELSKIWTKHGASPESIEDKIQITVPDLIEKFKLKNVEILIADINEQIKNLPAGSASGTDLNNLLSELKRLDEYKIALTRHIDKSALL